MDNPEEYLLPIGIHQCNPCGELIVMLDRLFKQSAIDLGKERFGIKFVRIGLEEMHYLEWLYPDAVSSLIISKSLGLLAIIQGV